MLNDLKIKSVLKCCLLLSPMIVSCSDSNDSQDIIVSEIKEPCDCMQAYDIVVSDMHDLISNFENKKEYDMDASAVEKGEKITAKYNEIDDRCDELNFSKKDLKDCDLSDSVEKKMKEINKKMRL